MKRTLLLLLAVATLATESAIAGSNASELNRSAQLAISTDEQERAKAIEYLRAQGEAGLRALLDAYGKDIQTQLGDRPEMPPTAWKRLTAALDAVGQQKDCHASQLFWLTDLEQAKSVSHETGKPILSLRLLGKLDEEFSCANSRFFRTTLYPNPKVSSYLRENFVLHWKSVRPVPRVTIDFGDGRKVERTVTGNSIHYVLAADGTPIDALPGLYSANEFLAGLSNAVMAAKTYDATPREKRDGFLENYHREQLASLDRQYMKAVTDLDVSVIAPQPAVNAAPGHPNAKRAATVAFYKGEVERAMIGNLLTETPADTNAPAGSIEQQMAAPIWSRIAALYEPEAKLDPASLQLVRSKNPTATAASRLALTKSFAEDPLVRIVANLERSIAEDTVRNKFVLHRQIHYWYTSGQAPMNVDQLNRKVYAELFLTPDSDPWLGLVPSGTFSALQDDGLVREEIRPN